MAALLLQTDGKKDTPCPSEPAAPLWSWRSNMSQPDWASQTPAGGSRGRNRRIQDLCLRDSSVKVVPGPSNLSLLCHSPSSMQGACMPLGECCGAAASHPSSLLSQLQRKNSQALASPNSCKSSQAKTLGPSENILQFSYELSFTWPVDLLLQALLLAPPLPPLTTLAPEKYGLAVELAANTGFLQFGLSAPLPLPCLAIQIASFGVETSRFVFLQQTYRPHLGCMVEPM